MKHDLMDYGNAPDVYCDGLGRIEVLGQTVCFLAFRLQSPEGIVGPPWDKIVNLKIIVPKKAIPDITRQILEQFGSTVTGKQLLEIM